MTKILHDAAYAGARFLFSLQLVLIFVLLICTCQNAQIFIICSRHSE